MAALNSYIHGYEYETMNINNIIVIIIIIIINNNNNNKGMGETKFTYTHNL